MDPFVFIEGFAVLKGEMQCQDKSNVNTSMEQVAV